MSDEMNCLVDHRGNPYNCFNHSFSGLSCSGGHIWSYLGEIPDGYPCNCGGARYQSSSNRIQELEEELSKSQSRVKELEAIGDCGRKHGEVVPCGNCGAPQCCVDCCRYDQLKEENEKLKSELGDLIQKSKSFLFNYDSDISTIKLNSKIELDKSLSRHEKGEVKK